jgi:hypothetical protein
MTWQHLDLVSCYEAGVQWCANPGNGVPAAARERCIEMRWLGCLDESGVFPNLN